MKSPHGWSKAILAISVLTLWAFASFYCRADETGEKGVLLKSESAMGGGVIIPSSDEIARIDATVYNSPLKLKSIGPFEVPPKFHKQVMAMFLEGVADDPPGRAVKEIGILRITTKDGVVRHIIWMWMGGKTNLRFSILGVRGARNRAAWDGGDDGLGMELTIRDIYRQVTGIDTFQMESSVPPK